MEDTLTAIDELLHDASERLDLATARASIPDFRSRTPQGARVAVALTCAATVAATWVVIAANHGDSSVAPITFPPGIIEGRYGTEVVMSEQPDGDDDPSTFIVRGDPGGGTVTGSRTLGGVVEVTAPSGQQASSPAELCLEAADGSGGCGTSEQLSTPQLDVGQRGVSGQVYVTGMPTATFAVIFEAGTDRHWSRPVRGIATFPFPEDASATVTTKAVDANGTILWQDTEQDRTLTDTEIQLRSVTTTTDETIPSGWFGDVPAPDGYGLEFLRTMGRTTLTGFQGPFATQGIQAVASRGNSSDSWIWAITIRAADLDAVRTRLDPLTDGSVRTTLEPTGDIRVLVWAGNSVSDELAQQFSSTIVERSPLADRAADGDRPSAWSGGHTPARALDSSPFTALVTDTVAHVDGHAVIAYADDIGVIQFSVADSNGGVANLDDPQQPAQLPAVGSTLFAGLWPVPEDITVVTLTLSDGSTITPTIIDPGLLAVGRLLYIGQGSGGRTIIDIRTTG
ncbi:MAG: hypothetical protein JWL72_2030 [Ilumatobacteraceae bacterium]|nr:hypothetical protein [Ilumatobacteraceae bacterium]